MQDLYLSSPSCVRHEALYPPLFKAVGTATTMTPRPEAGSGFPTSPPPLLPGKKKNASSLGDVYDMELPMFMDESSSTLLLPSLSAHQDDDSTYTPIRPRFQARRIVPSS
uniref:Uncharacterized protein n=1 Tax=Amphora coffeiformis TaxID=265554 RepID=A0A7S3LAW8_9STRA|mmetsp:Transcript_10264/g.19696  ORF Transcript_10264/g.19696 Transcript_10264/m.19696 type:complete len:110 (+) Transcript_10264:120-449(+)|eukprot:scaffold438_cov167-Amphora_coffeaeformis.AAC.1